MSKTTQKDVCVVGAGIIGAMTAYYLQRAGRSVHLVERAAVASGASAGNAGILAYPEITPNAAPGVMRKAPRWLLDPLGPLSIRPSYALKLAPWLWRFWRASAPAAYSKALDVEGKMMRLAQAEMNSLAGLPELSHYFLKTGTLDLYDSEASLRAAGADWQAKADAGFEFRRVGRSEIEKLQPGLAPQFQHAIFSPEGLQILEPRLFTEEIVRVAVNSGAQIQIGEATKIQVKPDGAVVHLADGQMIEAQTVVVCCGAWSKALASSLGEFIPLDTERGYNTTLRPQRFPLERQLYFNDHGFVVTPLSSGIRVGGAVEFGGLNLPPNFQRSDALLAKAKKFLPELQVEGGKQWMGFRPSLPDCLPAIGRSARSDRVIYAFGHGHLGLTQSAATARLVYEISCGGPTSIELDAFLPSRFA